MTTIKRLVANGIGGTKIVESELEPGFLFEIHGYQFAFVDNKEVEIRHLIELSTGHSLFTAYDYKYKKREYKEAVSHIKRVSKEKIDAAVDYVRKKYKLKKPLNEPINDSEI
jgi:hypothetical protein